MENENYRLRILRQESDNRRRTVIMVTEQLLQEMLDQLRAGKSPVYAVAPLPVLDETVYLEVFRPDEGRNNLFYTRCLTENEWTTKFVSIP